MLHAFNKTLLISIAIYICSSCNTGQDNTQIILSTLDHSLVTSSINIEASNNTIYNALVSRATERKTVERAKAWQTKALMIKSLSDKAYDYIEQLKKDLREQAGAKFENGREIFEKNNRNAASVIYNKNGEDLLKQLKQYKISVLQVDPELRNHFENTIPIDFPGKDGQLSFKNDYFRNVTAISAMATLSCFQNKIRNTENVLIKFCLDRTSVVRFGPCCGPIFLSNISSSCVKGGEKVKITAGIGTYSTEGDPDVTIAGKKIVLSPDGSAKYEFKASNKPGKYMVPVEIKFMKPDGTTETATKEIEYEVVKDPGD